MAKFKLLILIAIFIFSITYVYAQCSADMQYFEGACYQCDGNMHKKPDGQVSCIKCDAYSYYENGKCILQQSAISNPSYFGQYLDRISTKISPNNPFLGLLIILIVIIVTFKYMYNRWL